jgi:hypothetical protein
MMTDTSKTDWKAFFITQAEIVRLDIVEADARGATKSEMKMLKKRFNDAVKAAGMNRVIMNEG